jgi:hypothetical protein
MTNTPILLTREEERFEIAVGNFMRSCADLQANEAAFQAWYASSVIAEFGLTRVYREIHLTKKSLNEAAPTLIGTKELKQAGNEFFPDLSVSRAPAIDARHSSTRQAAPDAAAMLQQFAIVTEFKATGTTAKPTSPRAIRTDLFKLGVFAEAHGNDPPVGDALATYMIILDNYSRAGRTQPHYNPARVRRVLSDVSARWPAGVRAPTVIVGGPIDEKIEMAVYRDLGRDPS